LIFQYASEWGGDSLLSRANTIISNASIEWSRSHGQEEKSGW
jgi:hypothetical protein